MRRSEVAYIITCVRVDNRPHFLLLRHKKWGDWSLVGGHVEKEDGGQWAATAVREAQEELPPMQHRKQFLLLPIFSTPVTWGPVQSKSAQGRETIYNAQFFALEFLKDPRYVLPELAIDELRLVSQDELEHSGEMAQPIRILAQKLRGGLTSIPLAWQTSLEKSSLPPKLFDPIAVSPSN